MTMTMMRRLVLVVWVSAAVVALMAALDASPAHAQDLLRGDFGGNSGAIFTRTSPGGSGLVVSGSSESAGAFGGLGSYSYVDGRDAVRFTGGSLYAEASGYGEVVSYPDGSTHGTLSGSFGGERYVLTY